MTWNANSLNIPSKKLEFFDFLVTNKIDIALVNETFLKQGTSFSHPEYKTYRLDRVGALTKGGVAIMVRQDLPHKLLPAFRTRILECIGVSVDSASGPIEFISTYRPGGRSTITTISQNSKVMFFY